MATADSLDAEPAAFENAVFEDCFDHVLAASGRVATRWRRQGRDKHTVEIDRKEENLSDESFPFVICSW